MLALLLLVFAVSAMESVVFFILKLVVDTELDLLWSIVDCDKLGSKRLANSSF